ncbi:hypothetical protein H0H81_004570 [Sphagnurus paluster]|uniref:Calcineurin-like phosphoesterase domain-containing protein n=1 Tax=Sphagnurus paluster TaxID=117069 RepID=A0A9P7KMG5_9AGAR|nr:hypothetical protein H0H81_004570 [Sphagnurus paluster]
MQTALETPITTAAADSTGTVHIQLLSDLHLEIERTPTKGGSGDGGGDGLYEFDFPARADTLALLGDIRLTRLFDWLRAQLARFKTVLYVPGNHEPEPYWSSPEESNQKLAEFAEEHNGSGASASPSPGLGRFVLLNRRTRYDLSPHLTILGCTLWSRLAPGDLDILRWALADFRRIARFGPERYLALHAQDAAWVRWGGRSLGGAWWCLRIMRRRWGGTGDPRYRARGCGRGAGVGKEGGGGAGGRRGTGRRGRRGPDALGVCDGDGGPGVLGRWRAGVDVWAHALVL